MNTLLSYIALLVGIENGKFVYSEVEIISPSLPINSTIEIMDIVASANTLGKSVYYVDMYGYSYLGNKFFWEVDGTETERI